MHIEDLLVKEFETARSMHQFYHELKYKNLSIFSTAFVLLLSFTVKGDLPKQTYLFLAIGLFLMVTQNSYLNYRERCAWSAMRISEIRVSDWAMAKFEGKATFDLPPRFHYIRTGGKSPDPISNVSRMVLTVFTTASYLFLAYKGLVAYKLTTTLSLFLLPLFLQQ